MEDNDDVEEIIVSSEEAISNLVDKIYSLVKENFMLREQQDGTLKAVSRVLQGLEARINHASERNARASSMNKHTNQEREAFEAACGNLGLTLYAGSDSRYAPEIQCAWMLWQARTKPASVTAPEGWSIDPSGYWNDDENIYTKAIDVGDWGARIECRGHSVEEAEALAKQVMAIAAPVAQSEPSQESCKRMENAMLAAFHLGQQYWQQADSEYSSQHAKANGTRKKFDRLVSETVAELTAQGVDKNNP